MYNHFKPQTKKALNVGDALDFTTGNQALDYGVAGGGGAALGGGIGALINKLRGGSALKGGLIGAGIGGAAGLGTKALGDFALRDSRAADDIANTTIDSSRQDMALKAKEIMQLRMDNPTTTGDGYLSASRSPILSTLSRAFMTHPHPWAERRTTPFEREDNLLATIRSIGSDLNEAHADKKHIREQGLMEALLGGLGLNSGNKKAESSVPALNVGDALDFTTGDKALDYGVAGGGGALLGGGIGALINKLRGGSALKGGLLGAGIGGAAGLGAKALGDFALRDSRAADDLSNASISKLKGDAETTRKMIKKLHADFPNTTGEGFLGKSRSPHLAPWVDALTKLQNLGQSPTPYDAEDSLKDRLNTQENNLDRETQLKKLTREQGLMEALWKGIGGTNTVSIEHGPKKSSAMRNRILFQELVAAKKASLLK